MNYICRVHRAQPITYWFAPTTLARGEIIFAKGVACSFPLVPLHALLRNVSCRLKHLINYMAIAHDAKSATLSAQPSGPSEPRKQQRQVNVLHKRNKIKESNMRSNNNVHKFKKDEFIKNLARRRKEYRGMRRVQARIHQNTIGLWSV